jgi:hypothetical protein
MTDLSPGCRYLAMLDRLAGEADAQHECGYEEAVLRGSAALVPPVSACCASLGGAKAALDAVDKVRNALLLLRLPQCSPNDSIKRQTPD